MPIHICRSQKITNDVVADLTSDDLKSLGLTLGESKLFLKEVAKLSAPLGAAGGAALTGAGAIIGTSPSYTPPVSFDVSSPVLRCFASSNFKRIYNQTECPKYQDQVNHCRYCLSFCSVYLIFFLRFLALFANCFLYTASLAMLPRLRHRSHLSVSRKKHSSMPTNFSEKLKLQPLESGLQLYR